LIYAKVAAKQIITTRIKYPCISASKIGNYQVIPEHMKNILAALARAFWQKGLYYVFVVNF
jgi:hypothetical protein